MLLVVSLYQEEDVNIYQSTLLALLTCFAWSWSYVLLFCTSIGKGKSLVIGNMSSWHLMGTLDWFKLWLVSYHMNFHPHFCLNIQESKLELRSYKIL